MNNARFLVFFFVLGVFLAIAACGKKGPPFLSKREFSAEVTNLTGEWIKGEILLKGDIRSSSGLRQAGDQIKGSRVYYAQYSLEDPPCAGCPIEFNGYYTFGGEVITEEGFLCRIGGEFQGTICFFKTNLVGAGGEIGPPSNTVEIVVE